jgi:hypothetical protein
VVTAVDTNGLESDASSEAQYILTSVFDDSESPALPRTPYISRVYPNPFNSSITIEVFIPDVGVRPAPVTITIFNLIGQVESIAFRGHLHPGIHQLRWDGKTAKGIESSSGLYFARLQVWNRSVGKPTKVVLVK